MFGGFVVDVQILYTLVKSYSCSAVDVSIFIVP